ncbi:hemolysin III family protein [Lacinutrix sp. Bg11-31]|uniref:PAQR family membrane homeostasis protein TrhA n=1 Tax=Lacinutrix sp. Bg11-31 TaxID=2057808 RepID=UPI000C30BB2F|nr:hemolysin III family protein [Lacinutrix sp. Bg11-31]AUC81691.1 hemolysin III family protein [Lacinutrix sp. Bg11-31]
MRIQTQREEFWNTITHGVGAILGIIALVLFILKDTEKTSYSLFSVIVYGISIIVLFSASTIYHYVKSEKYKHTFRIIDHISIYLLIAGTYTPVLLISLEQSLGWILFAVVWGIAAFGVVLKIFFTGRFNVFSTLLYLVMGWLIVFDFSELKNTMPPEGITLLMLGGASYTIGIIFYALEKKLFYHVIWHLFVLAGAIFHFLMVYFYVV